MIRAFRGKSPQVHPGAYVDPSAQVIGDVMIGNKSSIWPGAVLRGDSCTITIGEGSSIQDNTVAHGDKGAPVIIKDFVTVGHNVTLHGCRVGSYSIIGIGATLLNHSDVGESSMVAAGSVVLENQKIPPRSLAVGVPAKVVRELTQEDIRRIHRNALIYVRLAREYQGKG